MGMTEAYEAVRSFLETGGAVLWVLFFVIGLMWTLTFERALYFALALPAEIARRRQAFNRRVGAEAGERPSVLRWRRGVERDRLVSEVRLLAGARLWLIGSLVGVCPLLGLLGTVVGMLEVFDVLSIAGNGNPRAMADGISRAIISTLAGLVGALSGLLPREQLARHASRTVARFSDELGAALDGAGEAAR